MCPMHTATPHSKKGRVVRDGPKRLRRRSRDRSDLRTQISDEAPLTRERNRKKDRIVFKELAL